MRIAATIHQNLGLTQHDLAKFIGGERSSLARAEKGERLLSADAILNLVALHKLQVNTSNDGLPGELMEPGMLEHFKYHALECRHKATTLRRKLKDLEQRYVQGRKLLQCLEQFSANYGRPLSTKQVRWIEGQRLEAEKKTEKGSVGLRKKLSLQIEVLEAEAAIYEREVNV